MDNSEFLQVRYHYNGEFLSATRSLTYVGGTVASSFIKRDKMSYLELIGHLKSHLPTYNEAQYLHWLNPGRQLFDGLKTIIDDEGCKGISNIVTAGEVAEIFVEPVMCVTEDTDGSNYEDEIVVTNEDGQSKKKQLDIDLAKQKGVVLDGDGSSLDSEYMPGDSEASDEDDEAISIKKKFKEFKKKLKTGKAVDLDDFIFEGHSVLPLSKSDDEDLSDESNDTPYYDSSEDEASYDEQSDGELVRNNEDLPRYNSKADVPYFALGMRFRGRKQFRRAIIKHGLSEKRAFKFVKNDLGRVRVKCTWTNCPKVRGQ
jgi:alpha-galactosidase